MNQTDREARKHLTTKLKILQQNNAYSEIAELITTSLQKNSSQVNREVFGYLPSLFREVELSKWSENSINSGNLPIGEPLTYKISFPNKQTMKGIPFFYLFCYIKSTSDQINVYFQSASQISHALKQQDYRLARKKIVFEGLISAFTSEESVICISDPGHFIPGLKSSFYVGTQTINFAQYIANIVENICDSAHIKLENTFLFGSSAGGMGALLSSTYFSGKVQVLAVNTQIYTHGLARVMNVLLGTRARDILMKKYGDRVSCLHRFKQNLRHVPNIYLLANVNDTLYQRNYKFYQQYQNLFVARGKANQSIFDSYYGVEGHGRPDRTSLKKKSKIAREALSMKSNLTLSS